MKINEITIEKLANEIKMSIDEVSDFLINKDDFTADFSTHLGTCFKVGGDFFYNLQKRYQKDLLEDDYKFKNFIENNYNNNAYREINNHYE